MHKKIIIFLTLIGVSVILAAFIKPAIPVPATLPENIPDSVWAVLEKSCYDCHSNEGNGMAKAKLDFDRWNEYAPDKQLAKARAICEETQEGKMPPLKYRKNNPEAVPTEVEAERICNWVKQLEK